MIIAVSSAPNVDKSRAVHALADKYKLEIHEDPMRTACDDYGFQTIYDMPAQLQAEVRERLIADHHEFVGQNSGLLLNYSVVEWLADWMRWSWNTTSTESWSRIMATAKASAQRYDHIYHVENQLLRPYDGYVWRDKDNSEQLNGLMKYLYDELQVLDKVEPSPA